MFIAVVASMFPAEAAEAVFSIFSIQFLSFVWLQLYIGSFCDGQPIHLHTSSFCCLQSKLEDHLLDLHV